MSNHVEELIMSLVQWTSQLAAGIIWIFFCSVLFTQMSNFQMRSPGLKNRQFRSILLHLICHLNSQTNWELDGRKVVFSGSALSKEEKVLLINFASKVGATVTKRWTSNVTHVIAATDANGACSRTLKVLMAILNGRWILKMDWIKACMEVMNLVEEEQYGIDLDNQGCHGGPKAGRLRALANVNILSLHFMFLQIHELSIICTVK